MKTIQLPTHRFFTAWALRRLLGCSDAKTKPAELSAVNAEKARLMALPEAQDHAEINASISRLHHHAKTCIQAEVEKGRLKKRRETSPRSRHIKRRALPFPSSRQPIAPIA